jgi:hypothetical protein
LKCEQYWPEGGEEEEEEQGEVRVRRVREDTLAFYTLRTFAIRHTAAATHTNRKKKVRIKLKKNKGGVVLFD